MAKSLALSPGSVAVVTGGASGIGLAAAMRFSQMGLRVCIADIGGARLEAAAASIRESSDKDAEVLAVEADVSQVEQLQSLEANVLKRFGGVDVLMNNAGIGSRSTALGPLENWQRILDVNLWGVIHGCQTFIPAMLKRARPGLIINTGSKQGITTPPGNPAYNVSKAGIKAYTEALQHELRNTPDALIAAHLLIPGSVHTGISGDVRREKRPGSWTAAQTIDFMLERLAAGDFYILCPDNEVTRELDVRRITWAANDIIENRPALSRWHPDYADAFKAFIATKHSG
jgi:NAD(P)-dependent dehydrogenase (short-subunit alcohol dehydrogenase family)